MEVLVSGLIGALASAVATHWYHMRALERSKGPKVVSAELGSRVILATNTDKTLEILEARWGDRDITSNVAKWCCDTGYMEFVVSTSLLRTITNDEIFLDAEDPQTLRITYQ